MSREYGLTGIWWFLETALVVIISIPMWIILGIMKMAEVLKHGDN